MAYFVIHVKDRIPKPTPAILGSSCTFKSNKLYAIPALVYNLLVKIRVKFSNIAANIKDIRMTNPTVTV